MTIKELFETAFESGASDIFLTAGKVPAFRRFGEVVTIAAGELGAGEIDDFRREILPAVGEDNYRRDGSADAAFVLSPKARFRINFLLVQGRPALVARPIRSGDELYFEKLHLPPALAEFAAARRGLILITGAAGSGKSTTMSAIINRINRDRACHIVTIENPIEYVHTDHKSLVTQRELSTDTPSFNEALKNVVRESPDVIVIGEMRDLNTMQTALSAALTGHLVISTLHTANTMQAVERIVNTFPEHLREQVSLDLSLALVGIVSQRLLPALDQSGMIPAVEILKATPMVKNLVGERNFSSLDEALRRGHDNGMITFTRALHQLYADGLVSYEQALALADHPEELQLLVRGMESGVDTFRKDFESENDAELVNMKRLLHSAMRNGASDLLLTVGARPTLRVNGDLAALDADFLSPGDTQRLLFSLLTPRQRADFEEKREIDFALSIVLRDAVPDGGATPQQWRFRVNGFYQRGNIGCAIRVIPNHIPSCEELGLPPALVKLADKKNGFVLITGPTGHGKSTTQASIIDRINSRHPCHIVTVEDPIEYVHENKVAVIEQREVNADTLGFHNALKYVLRQDPDVILIGEMRDPETIAAALTAAETGHLVLATLHTNSAPQSIDRIIDSFPAHQQNQIRLQLAGTLLAVAAQRLIPRKDGQGRVAAFEIMVGTLAVQSLIREGKTSHLQSFLETGFKDGMITMDKALQELYSRDLISRENYAALTRDFKVNKEFA